MNKKLLLSAVLSLAVAGTLAQNSFAKKAAEATNETAAPATVLLKNITTKDIDLLTANCGQMDSRAEVCAPAFNKIINEKFNAKMITLVTPDDVNLFWKQCLRDGGSSPACADNINSILAKHIVGGKYHVTEDDVIQVTNYYFAPNFGDVVGFSNSFFGKSSH